MTYDFDAASRPRGGLSILLRGTPLMLVPSLIFIVVVVITYSGLLKLAARILRYTVPWKSAFLFAGIMLVIVIFGHVLALSESLATRIGYNIVVLAGQIAFGSWFFSRRGTSRQGTILGWSGSLRLVALMFAMMLVLVFAIAMPIQVFLTNHLSTPP